jgi:hypothetical protein
MSNDTTASPCRLHVYLAREAPLGVVLRRGPSRWSRLSLWHLDTDVFEHGQWLRGRVFERRSDVSRDGRLVIAFIRDTSAGRRPKQRADTWIAISRPPYFTALALWWVGGTYCTGGFFPSASVVWPAGASAPDEGTLPAWLRLATSIPYVDHTPNWTDRTVYHNRLLRDGWQQVEGARDETWQRQQPGGSLTLRLHELGWDARAFGGPHIVKYTLETADESIEQLRDVTWADWDHRGRLLVVQRGRLLEWRAPSSPPTLIEDFNSHVPQPLAPPAWATSWPSAPDGV